MVIFKDYLFIYLFIYLFYILANYFHTLYGQFHYDLLFVNCTGITTYIIMLKMTWSVNCAHVNRQTDRQTDRQSDRHSPLITILCCPTMGGVLTAYPRNRCDIQLCSWQLRTLCNVVYGLTPLLHSIGLSAVLTGDMLSGYRALVRRHIRVNYILCNCRDWVADNYTAVSLYFPPESHFIRYIFTAVLPRLLRSAYTRPVGRRCQGIISISILGPARLASKTHTADCC